MNEVINVHDAKTHLSRLLDKAHAGEEIVLGKAGKPYAKLVPLSRRERKLGSLKEFKLDESFFDPLPEEELAAWQGRGR